MAYSFNIGQFVPDGSGLQGWAGLHQALSQISAQRAAKAAQERALEAQAQQSALARAAQVEAARVEEENRRAEEQRRNERQNQTIAGQAVQQAMLADSAGQPELADAAIAAAAPFGARARWTGTPEVGTAPQLREPVLGQPKPSLATPTQAMTFQLREPMTALPATGNTLLDAIAREKEQINLTQRGRDLGWTNKEVQNTIAGSRPVAPKGREFLVGDSVLGSVDWDERARQRVERARALLEPGALSRFPWAAEAAKRQQEAVGKAAAVGAPDAVDKAFKTRSEELRLGSALERAQLAGSHGRGEGHQIAIAKDQLRRVVTAMDKQKLPDFVNANAQLDATLQEIRDTGNVSAAGALRLIQARISQGTAQNLSDADANAVAGTDFFTYDDVMKNWFQRRMRGEEAPLPLQVQEIAQYAQAIQRIGYASKAAAFKAQAHQIERTSWTVPEYREMATTALYEAYSQVVPDLEQEVQRLDALPDGGVLRKQGRTSRAGRAEAQGPPAPPAPPAPETPETKTQEIVGDAFKQVDEALSPEERRLIQDPLDGL